ncbi:uncharacterized protein LOC132012478 [Mustela nigripes]|uniref:uncharacterized protein LOC132012478 n=1 Tax=Mustela nigripes TaxID=77151 RepID=UPI0028149EFB|nr:uncharacterized protein LOC132012478 [Mustela nigripes]
MHRPLPWRFQNALHHNSVQSELPGPVSKTFLDGVELPMSLPVTVSRRRVLLLSPEMHSRADCQMPWVPPLWLRVLQRLACAFRGELPAGAEPGSRRIPETVGRAKQAAYLCLEGLCQGCVLALLRGSRQRKHTQMLSDRKRRACTSEGGEGEGPAGSPPGTELDVGLDPVTLRSQPERKSAVEAPPAQPPGARLLFPTDG